MSMSVCPLSRTPFRQSWLTYSTDSRAGNPNRARLEEAVASLEGAKYCIAYSAGMAAISGLINLLKPGERVLSISSLYGGTMVFMDKIAPDSGIEVDYVDDFGAQSLKSNLKPATKLVWLETPSNPTMHVTDIKPLALQCQEAGVWLAIDNTFSSPIISQPLSLGADFVIHSATKYLNGHADVTMGVLSTNHDALAQTLRFKQNLTGATPSPFDCWLCQRGLKTIHLRVRQSSNSALRIATFLESHAKIRKVNYPILPSSSSRSLSLRQNVSALGGGMLSFRMCHGNKGAEQLCHSTKLFKWAVSLGGVESLIEIPATAMTHKALSKEVRDKLGVFEDLVRISVGCEEVEDLLEDLEQALEHVGVSSHDEQLSNGVR